MLSLPMKVVLYVCLGYLSGNIMYAYWVPKLLKGVDVRDYGADHNPGAANATLACGLPMGILCAVLDILKGTVPVTLALHVSDITGWALVPIVLAPVVGHAWPLLIPGKGGKAIATSFGAFIGLMPEILLAVSRITFSSACISAAFLSWYAVFTFEKSKASTDTWNRLHRIYAAQLARNDQSPRL